jgi:hypothetical protein
MPMRTEHNTEEPTTIDIANLEQVTGGCAACGNPACGQMGGAKPGLVAQQPGQLLQPPAVR